MSKSNQNAATKQEYRLPVARLYPDLTIEQQAEAEYFLTRYLEIIERICQQADEKNGVDGF